MRLEELEKEVVQAAVRAHCKQEDDEAQADFHEAVSALIEARFQTVKSLGKKPKEK